MTSRVLSSDGDLGVTDEPEILGAGVASCVLLSRLRVTGVSLPVHWLGLGL
jgi:hypothetical protein